MEGVRKKTESDVVLNETLRYSGKSEAKKRWSVEEAAQ